MKRLFGILVLGLPGFAFANEIGQSVTNLNSISTWQCQSSGYTPEYDVDYFWGSEMPTEDLAKESALQNCFLKQCQINYCLESIQENENL